MGSHSYHPEQYPDDDHQDGAARGLGLALLFCLAMGLAAVAFVVIPVLLARHWGAW